jgi:chromosome segregation ATPase
MRYGLEPPFGSRREGEDPVSDIDDLRARLGVVEDQVTQLAEDAAATRALAAMADRDVAAFRQEMRGHTRVLNALRETQLEQGRALQEHGRTLQEHGRELGTLRETQLEQGRTLEEQSRTLGQHGQTLGSLAAGQAAIMRHLGITQPDSAERTPDVD